MKYKKTELLQAIVTLDKVNQLIKNADGSTLVSMKEALEQCQAVAIEIGTFLETQGEVTAHIVGMLENYCEKIYQQSEHLDNSAVCRKLSKKIQKQLGQIDNAIKHDIPEDKKEVVFLPYKASMWDSLESIWKSLREDEGCNTYVIPIPYYEKNPDGSMGVMHYEGNEYPADVPITDWRKYDLQTNKPDEIYIHNPYDNWNFVTSVHPDFYASKLKEYTAKLIYVPYFILEEISVQDYALVDKMKHFCFLPGTIYADEVFVQSENIRQIYIEQYLRSAKENNLQGKHIDRKSLMKKFVAKGSPKIEKLKSMEKEKPPIPEEWRDMIVKGDDSLKIVIFYNTGISSLLAHSESWLAKLEEVLTLFETYHEEITLLWRPHPLIESTMKSMRPQQYEKYLEIRDEYIAKQWGIYDTSADLDRAILLSDAYYGDPSSVVQLFQAVNKPVMIQEVEAESKY